MPSFHIRAADSGDRLALNNLIHSAANIHNHLDWRPPEAWLGSRPFYLAWSGETLAGTIAAPPDLPDVAWVRLAAVASTFEPEPVLTSLWPPTREMLAELNVRQVACMLLDDWFVPLLEQWGFQQINDVVVLARGSAASRWRLLSRFRPARSAKLPVRIRPLAADDIEAVAAVDAAAFAPPWQYSTAVIQQALTHANWATVAETTGAVGSGIVGYQISSGGRRNGHLARLAVKPENQNQGIGRALVADLIRRFESRGVEMITVNTQRDNLSSIALYQSLGFKGTGEHYPVWGHLIAPNGVRS